jgi:hypothetical protein
MAKEEKVGGAVGVVDTTVSEEKVYVSVGDGIRTALNVVKGVYKPFKEMSSAELNALPNITLTIKVSERNVLGRQAVQASLSFPKGFYLDANPRSKTGNYPLTYVDLSLIEATREQFNPANDVNTIVCKGIYFTGKGKDDEVYYGVLIYVSSSVIRSYLLNDKTVYALIRSEGKDIKWFYRSRLIEETDFVERQALDI